MYLFTTIRFKRASRFLSFRIFFINFLKSISVKILNESNDKIKYFKSLTIMMLPVVHIRFVTSLFFPGLSLIN